MSKKLHTVLASALILPSAAIAGLDPISDEEMSEVTGQAFLSVDRNYHPDPSKNRSEEHTSELQSRPHLVCRLPLEKNTYVVLVYQLMQHPPYGFSLIVASAYYISNVFIDSASSFFYIFYGIYLAVAVSWNIFCNDY